MMRDDAHRHFFLAAALALLFCIAPARAQEVVAEASPFLEGSTSDLIRLEEQKVSVEAARLEELRKLFAEGLYARVELEKNEAAHAASLARLETLKMADAERRLAEARAEEAARASAAAFRPSVRVTSGRLNASSAMIRYTGKTGWSPASLGAVQIFFSSTFGRALPVSAFGQSATHDRFGYDHRNAVDVPVHPDSAEGRALIGFLQSQGIPFTAFRTAVPGVATGPHIHVGRPSGRVG